MAIVMLFLGRIGIVTGGGMGMYPLFANGAKVYITGQCSVRRLQMDVTDEEDVKAGAKHIEDTEGKLDILVNKFVYGAHDPLLPLQLGRHWADLFTLDLIALFFVIRALQSLLVEGASSCPQGTSSVIDMSSVAAKLNPSSPRVAYNLTKAALDKLTHVLATSFGERGIPIRVNALQPGPFASDILPPGQVPMIPARRHGSDAEMGMTAFYLVVSDYTNGAVLSVDGGLSLVNP
ncbi:NAD(P)-binding protein [Armillaria gallica]|uniref:NAD(P)-binding protein n=1 Tax=Armillaria gallica TaxID=47427 RepID=A0A2H3DLZ2_ARMGA|nr:NAD(P)-binding protein [Armillaria gallica]